MLRELCEEIQRIQAEIQTRFPLAQSAEQYRNMVEQLRRNIAFNQPDPFQPQAWQTVEDVLSGRTLIGEGDPHVNPTYYIDPGNGSPIAVAKARYGSESLGHGTLDDGHGEVVMSRVYQSLGMRSPRREMMRVGNDIWTVSEIMPPGESFGNVMRNNPEATLVFKQDVAKDSVARMIGGDPDAHFGNYRVGDDGNLVPFDNNLARPSPTHPLTSPNMQPFDPSSYGSAAELDEALEQWVRQDMEWVWNQTTRNWDGGALPVRQTVRWDDFDDALRQAEALTPSDLDFIHGADHLPGGAEAALNRRTMELRIKHLREFLRQRIPGAPSAQVIEFAPPGRDGFELRVAAIAA